MKSPYENEGWDSFPRRESQFHKERNESLKNVSENFLALQDYVQRKKTRYQTNDKPGGDMSMEGLCIHTFCPY